MQRQSASAAVPHWLNPHPRSLEQEDALGAFIDCAALPQAAADGLFYFVAQLLGDTGSEGVVDVQVDDAKAGW